MTAHDIYANDERWCPKCERMIPLTGYYRRANGTPTGYCKTCHKEATKVAAKKRHRVLNKQQAYTAKKRHRVLNKQQAYNAWRRRQNQLHAEALAMLRAASYDQN